MNGSRPRSTCQSARTALFCVVALASGHAEAGHGLYAINAAGLGEELTCIGQSHRDPNFVMIGTTTGRILRTVDGGATWQIVTVTPPRTLFFGRERSPDPRMEYALGLPGKSPHLQQWLRQKGLHTSGINMQQVLVQKGDKMVSVNWIEVDWNDEDRVYVGTVDGLYRSTDRGRTFIRIFQGRSSPSERMVNSVATDPHDPRRLLMGTANGLFYSRDRGATFFKTLNFYMRDAYIREIWFDPEQRGLVHVAMGGSAMASPDGGQNWITTHWDGLSGPRSDVQSISLGPQNLRLIGTRDGVFASWQGGEMGSWRRRGYRFVGTYIIKVLATTDPRVWFALTRDGLWVTGDAGLNWTPYFVTGGKGTPRWIAAHGGNPDHLWLITNRQVFRMGPPPKLRQVAPARAMPRRILDVPPLYTLHKRVLRHNQLYFPQAQGYRERGPWAALLPRITVGAHYMPAVDVMGVKDWQHAHWPYGYFNRSMDYSPTFEVFVMWDLGRLIFDKRELPHWGRIERNLGAIRRDLAERLNRLYQEYVRVARMMVHAPPADALTREYHKIRLQELTAYFDAVSGGYWSKALRGEQ